MDEQTDQGSDHETPVKRKLEGNQLAFIILSVLLGLFLLLGIADIVNKVIMPDSEFPLVSIIQTSVFGVLFALFLWMAFREVKPKPEKVQVLIDNSIEASKKNINYIVNKLYDDIAHICYISLIVFVPVVVCVTACAFWDSNLIVVLPFLAVAGFLLYRNWPRGAKRNIKYLIETNQTNIINEVLSGSVAKNNVSKIAFADNFFICFKEKVIIPYQDVSWVYEDTVEGDEGPPEVYLVIKLLNGDRYGFNKKWRKPVNGVPFEMAIMSAIREHKQTALIGGPGQENFSRYFYKENTRRRATNKKRETKRNRNAQ